PRSPELNSQENIWQFIRQNWLSNRMLGDLEKECVAMKHIVTSATIAAFLVLPSPGLVFVPTKLRVDTQESLSLGNLGIPLGKLIGGKELHDAFACNSADGLQLFDHVGLGDIGMSLADLIELFSSVLESRLKLFFLVFRK